MNLSSTVPTFHLFHGLPFGAVGDIVAKSVIKEHSVLGDDPHLRRWMGRGGGEGAGTNSKTKLKTDRKGGRVHAFAGSP